MDVINYPCLILSYWRLMAIPRYHQITIETYFIDIIFKCIKEILSAKFQSFWPAITELNLMHMVWKIHPFYPLGAYWVNPGGRGDPARSCYTFLGKGRASACAGRHAAHTWPPPQLLGARRWQGARPTACTATHMMTSWHWNAFIL